MKTLLLTSLAILMLASIGLAQHVDKADLTQVTGGSGIGIAPAFTPSSLLDGSRITWSHSYSVAFFSGGSRSGSQGMLRSEMLYDISDKLKLSLNVGVLHSPSALWGNSDQKATLLPGFRLDYRPAKNVFMSLSFQKYQGYRQPYYYEPGFGYTGLR